MSGQNYIGSKISLISLSDIRYVGILHNINSAESTVALQNVQSFGTEGRKVNINEEIPASDNIFDYVVFRGSDIKDLQVFEAPPSYKSESAVVVDNNRMMPLPSYGNYHHPPYYTPAVMTPSYNTNYWQNSYNIPPPQYPFQPQQQPQPMRMSVPEIYNNETTEKTSSASPDDPILVPSKPPVEKKITPTSVISQEKQQVSPVVVVKAAVETVVDQEDNQKKKETTEQQQEENIVDSLVKQVSDLDIKSAPELSQVTQERIFKQQQQQQQTTASSSSTRNNNNNNNNNNRNNNSRTTTAENNQRRSSHYRNEASSNTREQQQQGHRRRSSATTPRGLIVPRSDFDFTSANAKFDKSADDDVEQPAQFYNKEKSFFDDISCESKDGGRNNGKYHEERKLNLETFGQANPRGGGGRGGRGRGGGGGSGNKRSFGPNRNGSSSSNIESIA